MNQEIKVPMKDGLNLFGKVHDAQKDIWIIHTHGIGEHCDRHLYIPELFGETHNIFQYDLRGHGRSEGRSAWIDYFDHFMEDLHEIIFYLKENYGMKKYILMSHSMGSHITCGYMQNYVDKEFYPQKVFVNAPTVNVGGPFETLGKLLPYKFVKKVASIKGSFAVPGLVDLRALSHDPDVKVKYENDPLCKLKLHSGLVLKMLQSVKEIFSKPINPKCPAFVTVGSADAVVSYREHLVYFHETEKNFDLKVIDGAFHEIHNEIDIYREPYFEYMKKCIYA